MSDGFFPSYTDENKEIDNDIEQEDNIPFKTNDSNEWSLNNEEDVSMDNSVNQKNEEEFQEIMENASKKYDIYWDRDNAVIKIILYVLFGISAIGSLFYVFWWIFSNQLLAFLQRLVKRVFEKMFMRHDVCDFINELFAESYNNKKKSPKCGTWVQLQK